MRKRVIPFLLFVCMLALHSEAASVMKTNTGKTLKLEDVGFLLGSDSEDTFAIVMKSGDTIEGVESVTFSITLDVQSPISELETVKVYNNVVTNILRVSNLKVGSQVIVTRIDGAVMLNKTAENSEMAISVADFASGCYILVVGDVSVKFVKE